MRGFFIIFKHVLIVLAVFFKICIVVSAVYLNMYHYISDLFKYILLY